jgi:uncharacterized protein
MLMKPGIISLMIRNILILFFAIGCLSELTSCATNSNPLPSITTNTPLSSLSLASDSTLWQKNQTEIWNQLEHTGLTKLKSNLAATTDFNNSGWLKLAIISKQNSMNTTDLVNQLLAWRTAYPTHPGNALFPEDAALSHLLNTAYPHHIALLLPLSGPLSAQGQLVRDGFLSSYYESLDKKQLSQTVTFYDTGHDSNISALYQEALSKGADIVIGPLSKEDVQTLSGQASFPVNTLALNYTDNELGPLPSHFYEFGLSSHDETEQLAQKARNDGLSRAIIIAPQDAWGQSTVKDLSTQWQSLDGKIIDTYYYSPNVNYAQDIANLMHIDPHLDHEKMKSNNNKSVLAQQRRQDFDIIILLAQPGPARAIVPLLKYYYADNIPIYAISSVYTGTKDPDLNGVTFCDIPGVLQVLGPAQTKRTVASNRLFAVGRDAYILSHEIPRLTQLPYFPIYGATGALSLTQKQYIYRRLPWVQMQAGHV